MILPEHPDRQTGGGDRLARRHLVRQQHRAEEARRLPGPERVAETGAQFVERRACGERLQRPSGDAVEDADSSSPVMWSAWAWVNSTASIDGIAQSRSWPRRSGGVSTSRRAPVSLSITTPARVRRLRGSAGSHAPQSPRPSGPPTIGTPAEPPQPRTVTVKPTACCRAARRRDQVLPDRRSLRRRPTRSAP